MLDRMSEEEALDREISAALRGAQNILVVSHIRPDGDAVGSLLGLGLALQQAGKTVQMVLEDGVPSSFRGLEGSKQIVRHARNGFDLTVAVDCSDLQRTGEALQGVSQPDVNIDHHVTNLNFARLNLVEPDAVATAAVLTRHLPSWGFPITQPVASALLTGIVSDTIGFRTSNMNPQALRLAADLMEAGADLPELYSRALTRRSFQAARYWGEGLVRMQRKGRLLWTTLPLASRDSADYSGNDDADLVNLLSAIDDSDIQLIFVEQKGGRVKVSWRAQPGYDVSQIALSFGGGGHPAAAGADIPGDMEQVLQKVLEATQAVLNGSAENNHGENRN
jgi:phosphoesterase RecJ-like protein